MTSKGFGGLPPHEQRFWKLVNAMLEGYFADRPMEELAEDIQIKYQVKPGGGLWQKATKTIEDILSGDRESYEHLTEANKKHIFNMSIQIMTREGLVPGKDFSIADGGILIKDEALQPFLESMTPEDRAALEVEGMIKYPQQNPFKLLEDQLGVPFFANLQELAKKRIDTLDDAHAASYLAAMIGGLEGKHSWLEDYWAKFVALTCGDRSQAILDKVKDCEDLSAPWAWEDILFALGKGSELDFADGEVWMSKAAIRALSQVWDGGGEVPLAVVADKLESASNG
jgi:hypothetical protein